MGRQEYTPEMAGLICEQVAEGLSLRTICRIEHMPCKSTVLKWLSIHPEFADQYARAREAASDAMAEDILDIADDGTNDWMESNNPDNPGYRLNGEHINRSRLRIDSRKWLAAKLKPKKYGDYQRSDVELTGKDGGPVETANLTALQTDELKHLRELVAKVTITE